MAHRLEIIDQYVAVDVEFFVHQRGANDPRIVGEADDVAARRPGDGDRDRARQRTTLLSLEILPCRSEEHTSELQSLMRISYAVFCLKKKISTRTHTPHYFSTKLTIHH